MVRVSNNHSRSLFNDTEKKSGILYTIYNFKIVRLLMIMKDPHKFKEITLSKLENYSAVIHKTVNFIDDSMSVICTQSPNDM